MAKIGDILKSGALGIGTAALARNPDALRGFGLLGGAAADYLSDKDKEDEKKKAAGMPAQPGMKKGGKVKKMASGGSASKRADGCAQRGKTRGRYI